MKRKGVEHDQRKREVRKLVKSGLSKADASRITGIGYTTVVLWTSDMQTCKGRIYIAGMTLKVMKELVSKGYIFSGNPGISSSYKTLKKYFPVKRVSMRGMTVFFLEGNERKAMEAFLERRNLKSISWHKLGYIRKAFGIKKMKRE
jgi:hypothetical protein